MGAPVSWPKFNEGAYIATASPTIISRITTIPAVRAILAVRFISKSPKIKC